MQAAQYGARPRGLSKRLGTAASRRPYNPGKDARKNIAVAIAHVTRCPDPHLGHTEAALQRRSDLQGEALLNRGAASRADARTPGGPQRARSETGSAWGPSAGSLANRRPPAPAVIDSRELYCRAPAKRRDTVALGLDVCVSNPSGKIIAKREREHDDEREARRRGEP